jgi:hypothetical protein
LAARSAEHVGSISGSATQPWAFFGTFWRTRGCEAESPATNPFTVRALAYITAGHAAHHMAIVREKYL